MYTIYGTDSICCAHSNTVDEYHLQNRFYYIHVHIYVCVHICMYMYIHICMYMYIHIYTYMHKKQNLY